VKRIVSELTITYLPIVKLEANPHNSRTHSRRQIRQIAASIKAVGFTNPVLVDNHNTIIAGHGRVAAGKLLGMTEVPTIRLENLSPDQTELNSGWKSQYLEFEFTSLQHVVSTAMKMGFV
jgi:ParB-like chromosome segregation protein Spo0J